MSAVIIQNELVHYEVLGRGRPVLFLHGWVGSWRYWIPAMQAVSMGYRAYALDLWGFGDTAKSSDRYILLEQVNLLQAFLDHLGIGKIALIGHGLGALVGLLFASRSQSFVDRLMLVSIPLGSLRINSRLQNDHPQELSDWLLDRNQHTEALQAEVLKADPQAIRSSLNGFDAEELLSISRRLGTALLFVHGLNDLAVPLNHPETHLVDQPEHIHSILFEQSGHFPMLDEPSKFNRLMGDFLALESGKSPGELQLKEEWKRRVR